MHCVSEGRIARRAPVGPLYNIQRVPHCKRSRPEASGIKAGWPRCGTPGRAIQRGKIRQGIVVTLTRQWVSTARTGAMLSVLPAQMMLLDPRRLLAHALFLDLLLRRQVQPLGFLGWKAQLQKQIRPRLGHMADFGVDLHGLRFLSLTMGKIRQALSGKLGQPQASSVQVNFRDTVWEIQTDSLRARHRTLGCLRLRGLPRRNCRISDTRIDTPGWRQ